MTDLEQKLLNEWSKQTKQYAEDQQQLCGQIERLEKQVQRLDESHAAAERGYNHCMESLTLLKEDNLAITNFVKELSEVYATQQSSFRSLADGFIELQRDITELAR